MSGKTFYIHTRDISVFGFFANAKYTEFEQNEKGLGEKNVNAIKFCVIHFIHATTPYVEGIIQFQRRITPNKARYYFLIKQISSIRPVKIGLYIPYYLTHMKINEANFCLKKYENGSLSLGGGHRNYNSIVNNVFTHYSQGKNKRFKDRLSNKILDLLETKNEC